jgi:hypothetical protein
LPLRSSHDPVAVHAQELLRGLIAKDLDRVVDEGEYALI